MSIAGRDPKERVVMRKASRNHRCWAYANHIEPPHVDGVGDCTRMIMKGEEHVVSTIYPGHESGYADATWDRPARPVTTHHCINCGHRWRNLRAGLEEVAP